MPASAEKNTIVQLSYPPFSLGTWDKKKKKEGACERTHEKKMNKNGRFPRLAALMNLAPIALPILCGVSFFHPGPSEIAAGPLEGDLSIDII